MVSATLTIEDYFNASNEQLFQEQPKTNDYYASITHKQPFNVTLMDAKRGKGLIATELIKKETIFIQERAIVSMQCSMNKKAALVCAECHRFLGSLEEQMKHVLNRDLTAQEQDIFNELDQDAEIKMKFKSPEKCACKTRAYQLHHKVLCPSTRPEIAADLEEFYNHADSTNEIFRLAALIYARITLDMQDRNMTLEEALMPFRMFVKKHWWDVIEAEAGEDPETYEIVLKAVLSESLELLKPIFTFPGLQSVLTVHFYSLLVGLFELNNLSTIVPHPVAQVFLELPDDLQNEFSEKLVACLPERGEPCCEGDHCEHDEFEEEEEEELEELEEDAGQGSSSSVLPEEEEEQEDWEDVEGESDEEATPADLVSELLICEGTGLHPLQATINHSCEPNARVYKGPSMTDSTTMIVALRDIQPGEEILISYFGEEDDEEDALSGEERLWALREYGIESCGCKKCDQ